MQQGIDSLFGLMGVAMNGDDRQTEAFTEFDLAQFGKGTKFIPQLWEAPVLTYAGYFYENVGRRDGLSSSVDQKGAG